jgi:hypothetical protein
MIEAGVMPPRRCIYSTFLLWAVLSLVHVGGIIVLAATEAAATGTQAGAVSLCIAPAAT